MIVDDLSANRAFLVLLLQHHGHRLLEAVDGAQGLTIAQAEHPDLIITDVLMPVMDGYELVRQLRLDPMTRQIPVVFNTAHYGEYEARTLALSSGVAYVLTKPTRSEDVLSVVHRALSGESESGTAPEALPLTPEFAREHLRLVTDTLSTKTADLRVANARLRALINIGLELASERDSHLLLEHVCVAARELFGATYITLGIVDLVDGKITHAVTSGIDVTNWINIGDPVAGIFQTVVNERRTLRGEHSATGPQRLQFPLLHPEVRAFLAAPLASPNQVYGWICLVGNEGRAFTEDDEQLVIALSGQVGRVYENSHFYALAQQRANQLEREILEREEAEAALRKSDRLNRNLVEHLPHRILVKDRNSIILFCNENYAKDLGLSLSEVIGKDAFAFYPPGLAAAYNIDDQEVMARGTTKDMEEPYRVDGEERWLHTVKVPYRDEHGSVVGILVVFEDITERKQLEEQFRQSQKMEAIGRLAGGVAHDFNNLLTVILGHCELLLGDLDPVDPRQEEIEEIQKAGISAAGLTRQLLAFSRKQIIEPKLLDLNAILADMRAMLGRLIPEDVKVVLRLAADLAHVKADRGQLEQIVMNLAVNARDAMPHGGTLTIETSNVDLDENYPRTHLAAEPGAYVMLVISDTGTGMTPAVQSRLFEPFFTTKDVGKGTGLGLATVHGIVKQSGGTVNVYSEAGRGTSIKVYFPNAGTAAIARELPTPTPLPRTQRHTVLLVEDSDAPRELARKLLQRQGYAVLVAANAEEALDLFAQHASIDVLLTDVVMPGTSGPELTRQLVAQRPALKVIYMSGYTEDAIIHRGVLNHGIAFLHKPFTAAALERKLSEVLDRAEPV